MMQRMASGRERLEELLSEEHRAPLPVLLLGLVPLFLLALILMLAGVVHTPLSLDGQGVRDAQTLVQPAPQNKTRAEPTVRDRAQQLESAIAGVQESAQRLNDQLERAQGKLDSEKSALASLQSQLDQIKSDTASGHPGNLEVRKGSLELRYKTWLQARADFQSALIQLESSLSQVDSQSAGLRQAAAALDEVRQQNPTTRIDSPAPGDEQDPLDRYQAAADRATGALPSLQGSDAEYQKAADAAIAEGRALGTPPVQPGQGNATTGFKGGFADVAGQIPDVVGTPIEAENQDPTSGDTVQHTTHGMLVLRKSDNRIAFTDGSYSWILGPQGLQKRENEQRFDWEKSAGQ